MKSLFEGRRFVPIFLTQFFGAFNDNVFKNALVILITFQAYSLGTLNAEHMVALCGGVFILPFFLFSSLAGQISDKFSKSKLTRLVKVWEVLVMSMAVLGFMLGNVPFLIITLFLMGTQSAFFGPVKYAILPELVEGEKLIQANAYVEMGTFIAILLGTIYGGISIAQGTLGPKITSVSVIIFALIGYLCARGVPELPARQSRLKINYNIFSSTWEIVKISCKNVNIFLAIMAISWFWFVGAAILSVLPPYCKDFLVGNENLVTFFLALFSVGVGAGSLLCEKLSFRILELGLVPMGAIGMSVFLADLFLAGAPAMTENLAAGEMSISMLLSTFAGWRIAVDFFMFSVAGGLFIVPLYTYIQEKSPTKERSRVIASLNIINSLFMVVAAVLLVFLYKWGFSYQGVLLTLAVLNLLVAFWVFLRLPEFLLRFISWIIANVCYRMDIRGRSQLPKEGAALVVANHMSFVDWLFLVSSTQRPLRMVMHHRFLKSLGLLKWVFTLGKVIPIASKKENPEILEKDPVPVIPVGINNMWGSFFSLYKSKGKYKVPFRRFWSRVKLRIGDPLIPAGLTLKDIERGIRDQLD